VTSGPPSRRTEVHRLPERAVYDRDVIDAIVDEALVCYVGIVHDGGPVVVPTIHARVGDTLYLHGSPASRLLRAMRRGDQVCVTIALVDGLVVARTPFNNSMNYRSVMVFGEPRFVDDPQEKDLAFAAITEHVLPGRWEGSRPPNDKESRGTLIVALPLDESSAKVRTGGPNDEAEDYGLPIWAGVIPVGTVFGEPEPDERLEVDVEVPSELVRYRRPGA
jgi:nitroimidazol reductase NimA-like FMN-containing flavoprotein (pyridoxamine 5'-phosphate oxidase superfamily)